MMITFQTLKLKTNLTTFTYDGNTELVRKRHYILFLNSLSCVVL